MRRRRHGASCDAGHDALVSQRAAATSTRSAEHQQTLEPADTTLWQVGVARTLVSCVMIKTRPDRRTAAGETRTAVLLPADHSDDGTAGQR